MVACTLKEKMRSLSLLLASAAAALATPLAAAPPARAEIAYEILREDRPIAEVVLQFEHAGGRYRIVETWKGRGVYALAGGIVRTSRGSAGPDGVRPAEFTDERSRRAPSRAEFDWSAGTLTTQRRGETHTHALPADAQDRLSFLLALALAPPQRRPVSFSVTDGGGLSHYVYGAAGRERVKVAAGEFDAIKVARRPERADDRRVTEIWLAPSLGGLPVRILLVDKDGARLDQQATRITLP